MTPSVSEGQLSASRDLTVTFIDTNDGIRVSWVGTGLTSVVAMPANHADHGRDHAVPRSTDGRHPDTPARRQFAARDGGELLDFVATSDFFSGIPNR